MLSRQASALWKASLILSAVSLFIPLLSHNIVLKISRRIRNNLLTPAIITSRSFFCHLCCHTAKKQIKETLTLYDLVELTLHRNTLVAILLKQAMDKKLLGNMMMEEIINLTEENDEYLESARFWMRKTSMETSILVGKSNMPGMFKDDLEAFMTRN